MFAQVTLDRIELVAVVDRRMRSQATHTFVLGGVVGDDPGDPLGSPRLAKMCLTSVNGAWPTQVTPSPPMWVKVAVLRSIQVTM